MKNNDCRVLGIYCIKDELTGKYYQPLYMGSDEEAIRYFKYVLNDNKLWKSNAAMYSLFYMGDFNEGKGFIGIEPKMIQGGLSVLEKE